MYQYHCLNPIAEVGLDLFTEDYQKTEELNDAQAVLVRSAAMHDLELPEGLEAIARAGAGVNNIPLEKCADQGIVVFNTPGANANGVKELVFAGMLLGVPIFAVIYHLIKKWVFKRLQINGMENLSEEYEVEYPPNEREKKLES